jgi:hypothetical protein
MFFIFKRIVFLHFIGNSYVNGNKYFGLSKQNMSMNTSYYLSLIINKVIKLVDLKNSLYGEIFELSDWTVQWSNGADFAPEYLYELNSIN